MSNNYTEVHIRGRNVSVPAAEIDGRTVVVAGKWLKIAAIKDEELVEGELVPDPERLITALRSRRLRADLVTFCQAIDERTLRFPYPFEWDNVAAIDTKDLEKWWENLPPETRKNTRRAAKRGVTVRLSKLDDDFVKGIKGIYDESPVRQGVRFWHYGKDLERIRIETETYHHRSEYIGAYYNDQLIGFMKWVYVDKVARIMHVISMSSHYDKRPANAMIAKAVEVCCQKGIHYLVYSKFTFGNKSASPLSIFKRRNGFVKMEYPRYYVPLTLTGRWAVKFGLHRGLLGMLPPRAIDFLWIVRSRANQLAARLGYGRKAGDESKVDQRKAPATLET